MKLFTQIKSKQKNNNLSYKNPIEAVKKTGPNNSKNAIQEIGGIFSGAFDQLTNNTRKEDFIRKERFEKEESRKVERKKTIFDYTVYHEESVVQQEIKRLMLSIKKEIENIKSKSNSLDAEIREIERLSLENLPSGKEGIYHVRFLEIVLRILKTLSLKLGESKTWLAAMISRKKKRGSLFLHLTKKKGTQYSLSQELQIARQTG